MHEVLTQEVVEAGIDQFIGKPVVVYVGGRRRVIGEVTSAHIDKSRTGIRISATITDEEVAGILGAAQDKNQAAASEIGLSESEIDAILENEPDSGIVRSTVGTINIKAKVA